jgi:hypothetical protein
MATLAHNLTWIAPDLESHVKIRQIMKQKWKYVLRDLLSRLDMPEKWYARMGLGGDMRCWTLKMFERLSLICNRPLKFQCDPY